MALPCPVKTPSPRQGAEEEVADFMVVRQGIHSHVWEEELDLLHCRLAEGRRTEKRVTPVFKALQ